MTIGETILGAVIQVVLQQLASPDVINFFHHSKISESLVNKLKQLMLAAGKLSNDAEEKSFNKQDVKQWHDELKHWFYRAEEVVDVIATKALQSSIESPPNGSAPSCGIKVPDLVSSFDDFKFAKTINKEMREIVDMLEGMLRQSRALGLREVVHGVNLPRRLPTTSLLVDEVYGRKEEKDQILEFLKLEEEPQGSKIGVVAIVGMGGIGKTTFAKFVYNDGTLQDVFHPKVWVSASEDPSQFDVSKVTRSVLTAVTGQKYSASLDLNFLQNELSGKLSDKRFLLVLDDVWNENYPEWETLQAPLLSGAKGSKIIVTTRNDKVADVVGATKRLPLSLLSANDGLELLFRHALVDGNWNEAGNLKEDIGKRIVAKCQRLPLAIKTIASHLRGTHDISEWERVLNSNLWEFSNGKSDVIPALWISYSHLPPYLKRCFSYCATYPKGTKLMPYCLVNLWMAENFIVSDDTKISLEDVGHDYLQQLLSRSFLEATDEVTVKMHDLMHELAQLASGDFVARDNLVSPSKRPERVRHLSYLRTRYGNINNFPDIPKMKHLRTFAQRFYHSESGHRCFLSERVTSTLISHLNHLRVLELIGYELFSLPESIGRLKQLRCLDVSDAKIKHLPKSVSTLYNLQTLALRDCQRLERLPADMGKLAYLRCLDLWGTTSLQEMPRHMGNLKRLRYLSDFVVGNNRGSDIKELRELQHIGTSLALRRLQNVTNPDDAHDINLSERESIVCLVLEFDCEDTTESEKDRQVQLLENLKPSTNLQDLRITNYAGRRFPKWLDLDCARYVKTTILQLCGCSYTHTLPPLGLLLSLKQLWIAGMDHVETVGDEFYGYNNCNPFPSLELLRFENMKGWKVWSNVDAQGNSTCFPRLQKLCLFNCPNLVGNFPIHSPLLCMDVQIDGCAQFGGLVSQVSYEHMLEGRSSPSAEFGNVFDLSSIFKLGLAGLTQLVKLPSELVMLSSLRELTIVSCVNLKSLANVLLPPEVNSLEITHCELLESLPSGLEFLRLYQMALKQCPRLSWTPGDNLPTSLTTLTIKDCESLELHIEMQHYMALEELILENTANNLVSFPLGIFPNLASRKIWSCKNLEKVYIPEEVSGNNLTSLRAFGMAECPKLEMVGKRTGRGEATMLCAPNLGQLQIEYCENVKAVDIVTEEGVLLPKLRWLAVGKIASEWTLGRGLSRLSSLTILVLSEQNVECFPNESFGCLPTSLQKLMIYDFPKLRELDGRSLQTPTSLQELWIGWCPELERLPKEGLPPSLSVLHIKQCPKVEKRCRRKKGREWEMIKHLPTIIINDLIFLPDTHGIPETVRFDEPLY